MYQIAICFLFSVFEFQLPQLVIIWFVLHPIATNDTWRWHEIFQLELPSNCNLFATLYCILLDCAIPTLWLNHTFLSKNTYNCYLILHKIDNWYRNCWPAIDPILSLDFAKSRRYLCSWQICRFLEIQIVNHVADLFTHKVVVDYVWGPRPSLHLPSANIYNKIYCIGRCSHLFY